MALEHSEHTIDYDEIMLRLHSMSEPEYALFTRRTNPTAHEPIGVRVPKLRALAKEYRGFDFHDFFERAKAGSWEEQMLCAMLIGALKGEVEERLWYLKRFVPYIEDWAVNDTLTADFKVRTKERDTIREFLIPYLLSDREFEQRFGVVMLTDHFLQPEDADFVFKWIDRVGQEEYYSMMAVAWLLATALAKLPSETEAYITGPNRLPLETLRMTVRKAYDSYRVPRELYERIRDFVAGEQTVDLHIHSSVSDGTVNPENIPQEVQKRGVSVYAVCDHDFVEADRILAEAGHEATRPSEAVCRAAEIVFGAAGTPVRIDGVELNSLYKNNDTHILGLGVDTRNEAFLKFVAQDRKMLDDISVVLLERMQKDGYEISFDEFERYDYDHTKGGWKTLYYLVDKGFAADVSEAMGLYAKYDAGYDCVAFPSVPEAIAAIHAASGVAILAHPGVTLKRYGRENFEKEFLELMQFDFDGVECYYSTHRGYVKNFCLDYCEEHDLLITSGSDCHGSFSKPKIGDPGTRLSQVRLCK